jgi:hypothetical protein
MQLGIGHHQTPQPVLYFAILPSYLQRWIPHCLHHPLLYQGLIHQRILVRMVFKLPKLI